MQCLCAPASRRLFFAQIQLFSQLIDGVPGGAAPPIGAVKEIKVCTECGYAEFFIPQLELCWLKSAP
jgi:hypothetical protein